MTRPHTRCFRRTALAILILGTAAWSTCVLAVQATFMGAEITRDEPGERPGLFVAAHYEFDLPAPLLDVLHRGIALYFAHEFRLTSSRWYWRDKTVADETFLVRLSFDPLTRRYRVGYSGLSLNFDSLEQALPLVKNIRRWRVAPSDTIGDSRSFTAQVRFHLDTTKLPKPMQVTTDDSIEWSVESDWTTLRIDPSVTNDGE